MNAGDIFDAILEPLAAEAAANRMSDDPVMRVSWTAFMSGHGHKQSKVIVVRIAEEFLDDHANDSGKVAQKVLDDVRCWARRMFEQFDPYSDHGIHDPPPEELWVLNDAALDS